MSITDLHKLASSESRRRILLICVGFPGCTETGKRYAHDPHQHRAVGFSPDSEPFLQDPKSVHISWQTYFKGLDGGLPSGQAFSPPPQYSGGLAAAPMPADGAPSLSVGGNSELADHLKVSSTVSDLLPFLINSILRVLGATLGASLPSSWTPHRQARSFGYQ